MSSQPPIPFHLSLSVPSLSMPDIVALLPNSFVVENWTRFTDYADVTTIGSPLNRQLAIDTRVEITGHISPYWPND